MYTHPLVCAVDMFCNITGKWKPYEKKTTNPYKDMRGFKVKIISIFCIKISKFINKC